MVKYMHVFPTDYREEASQDEEVSEYESNTSYNCTCKWITNRWPMIMFYNILDMSAYNAYILWTWINIEGNKNIMYKRRLFLEKLVFTLIEQHIASKTDGSHTIVKSMKEKYGESHSIYALQTIFVKSARCKFFCTKKWQ